MLAAAASALAHTAAPTSGLTAGHYAPSAQGLPKPLLEELLDALRPFASLEEEQEKRDELAMPDVNVLTLRGGEGAEAPLRAFTAFHQTSDYLGTKCHVVWVQEVWVDEQHRRTRLGTRLISAVKQPRSAVSRDTEECHSRLAVARPHAPATGRRPIGRRELGF